MADPSQLVARVRARVEELRASPKDDLLGASSTAHAPVSEVELMAAEQRLGFAIVPTLRTLYLQTWNGGYGPGYGLLGLVGGAFQEDGLDTIGVYEQFREMLGNDPLWRWPEKLLPVVHLGCGMFHCVDCSDDRGMVVWFEPNPHEDGRPWDDAFYALDVSFENLMLGWAAGEDWWERMRAAFAARHPEED